MQQIVFLDDIGYGPWSLWSECDAACGLGKKVRQRVCLNESNCAKEGQQQTKTCAANLCPVDGGLKHSFSIKKLKKQFQEIASFSS